MLQQLLSKIVCSLQQKPNVLALSGDYWHHSTNFQVQLLLEFTIHTKLHYSHMVKMYIYKFHKPCKILQFVPSKLTGKFIDFYKNYNIELLVKYGAFLPGNI